LSRWWKAWLLGGGRGGLLVELPGADRALWITWGRRKLAFGPSAQLRAHGAAEDAVLDWSNHARRASAAELLELRLDEWPLQFVDSAAHAEKVVNPEGLLHEDIEVKEALLGLNSSLTCSADPLVEADAWWGAFRRWKGKVLGDAEAVLHSIAEAVRAANVGRVASSVDTKVLLIRGNERRHWADAAATAEHVVQPLVLVEHLGAIEVSHGFCGC